MTRGPVQALLDEWLATRAALAELERAEHPDITDRHGRVWTWISGDLYRHDQMAWPADMIERGGLPSPELAANPNYRLCAICTQDWPRPGSE